VIEACRSFTMKDGLIDARFLFASSFFARSRRRRPELSSWRLLSGNSEIVAEVRARFDLGHRVRRVRGRR
jgi:hypothetical protein